MITALRADSQRLAYLALTNESWGRAIRLVIVDERFSPFNLTGFSVSITVQKFAAPGVLFTKPLTVIDAAGGVVEFVPDGRDFAGPGLYAARIVLENPDVRIETAEFPISVL